MVYANLSREITLPSFCSSMSEMSESVEDIKYITKVENPILEKEPESYSSLALASFNLSNCIIGTGIITLPYSMTLAGLPFGLVLVSISAVLTSTTLCMLSMMGYYHDIYNYIVLTHKIFGKWASLILAICHILFPIFISISYTIAITDNLQIIMFNYFPHISILSNRYFITSMISIFILLPLSIAKSISVLDKFSTCSVLFCIYYSIIIIVYSILMGNKVFYTESVLHFIKPGIAQAFGSLAFSMTPHHNWFQIQRSIKNSITKRNSSFIIINIAIFMAMFIYYLVSISGFFSFSENIQSNIFSNYCSNDNLINFTRAIFSITILLSYPLQILSAREVIQTYIFKNKNYEYWLSVLISITLVLVITLISFTTSVLGPIVEIGGSLTASPISLIFPPLLYIKTFTKGFNYFSLTHFLCYIIILVGIFGMLFGTSMTIYTLFKSTSSSILLMEKYFCVTPSV